MRSSRPWHIAYVLVAITAVVAAVALLRSPADSYTIRAQFPDAGQLVKGGVVDVAGRPVGKVSDLQLTDDGLAEVVLSISDERLSPLHRGTIAQIRQVGLSGVANRYVQLYPGPRGARPIPDNGVLEPTETRGIVDLDALLNALDTPTRSRIKGLLHDGARTFAGAPSPRDANRTLSYLNPALSQVRGLSQEALTDQVALERLLESSAVLSGTLVDRRRDLEEGLTNTATLLTAVSRERASLADILTRAPSVMRRTRRTLRNVRDTLPVVRPALREARPVARPLARTLRTLVPTVQQAVPVVSDLRQLAPSLDEALDELPALERQATPAIRSLTATLVDLLPIVRGLRPYTTDLITGLFIGFGGSSSGYYDANGHFARISAHLAPDGVDNLLLQPLDPLVPAGPTVGDLLPGLQLDGYRTGLDARCPGAAVEAAPDGSNPWRPDQARCQRDHDHDP